MADVIETVPCPICQGYKPLVEVSAECHMCDGKGKMVKIMIPGPPTCVKCAKGFCQAHPKCKYVPITDEEGETKALSEPFNPVEDDEDDDDDDDDPGDFMPNELPGQF